ncbi:DEAD/DEAH box helicase family protein [Dietzia maris]|uniref:DEAD/DEAH box helicase family protein n=1 Tax=Dietzia maris TaxID=37915 RepID=UPI00344E13B8
MAALNLHYRPELVEELAASFSLRPHNTHALDAVAKLVAGDYDPAVQQVLDMATGAGKTYLMAAFVEYLRRQGVYKVLVVTPGLVVQEKTVHNFTPGHPKYIAGAGVPAQVVAPGSLRSLATNQLLIGEEPTRLYVFNIQQLIGPKDADDKAKTGAGLLRRGLRRDNEVYGNVFAQLKALDDLVIIADESHLYGESAAAFRAALEELDPALCLGLTASSDPSDHVIFRYPLYKAIEDRCVKTPVLAFRESGYTGDMAEELQLRDALTLLSIKEKHYANWAEVNEVPKVNPVLFVTCADTTHAKEIEGVLAQPSFLGDPKKVLRIDSTNDDATVRQRLDALDTADSPVRAVVSVNMLKEGWDVKNIAVLCALRVSKSAVLTQQTMGRGLRLPYGKHTGTPHVDQLDIISHESYRAMLKDEAVLKEFGLEGAMRPGEKPVPGGGGGSAPGDAPENGADGDADLAGGGAEGVADGTEDASGGNDDVADGADGSGTGQAATDGGDSPASDGEDGEAKPKVGTRSIDDEVDGDPELHALTVGVKPQFARKTFLFPSTRMERETAQFSLSGMRPTALAEAGARVSGAGVQIERRELTFRSARARKILDTTTAVQVEGQAAPVDSAEVPPLLLEELVKHPQFPRTASNRSIAEHATIPTFMASVTTPWTAKSVVSAIAELTGVLVSEIRRFERELGTKMIIDPVELPISQEVTYAIGTEVFQRLDGGGKFVQGRLYEPWNLSLFSAVPFDSYSGEYRLAELADKSEGVSWWKRLLPHDKAKIAYTVRDNYYPDFVVYDKTDAIHWIVEAKAANKRDEENVEQKRVATDQLVTELIGDERFSDERWGYFIAYEDDIAAVSSWSELKARVKRVGYPKQATP